MQRAKRGSGKEAEGCLWSVWGGVEWGVWLSQKMLPCWYFGTTRRLVGLTKWVEGTRSRLYFT